LLFQGITLSVSRSALESRLPEHLTPQIRAQRIIAGLTGPVQQDLLAKADYRLFVLQAALVQTLERLEGLK
jgi:hypothetical protein